MSHYNCPTCSGSTSVIETRVSKKGLRRRRRCGLNHRFTTIELPHDTGKRITGLINWLTKQGLEPDLVDYAQDELKAIMSGQPPEDDDHDIEAISQPSTDTIICGPTGTHSQDPESPGPAEAASENLDIQADPRTESRIGSTTASPAYQAASETTP
jgi:hypothetical protein